MEGNFAGCISESCRSLPGVEERAVSFSVGGSMVRGILSLPADGETRKAVLFSHGWSSNRNGPAGLLKEVARSLSAAGCACMRFDFRGRGESGGDGLGATLATMSEDLVAASRVLAEASGLRGVTLFGMCSGGNVAIGSLGRIPQADGIFMVSVYPFSDGDSFGRDVHRIWHTLGIYLHKACSLESWRRLYTGDASLARVFGVLFKPFLKHGEAARHEKGAEAAKSRTVKASSCESRLQEGREPPQSYLAGLRKGMHGIMVYGTGDPDAGPALRYYGKYVEA